MNLHAVTGRVFLKIGHVMRWKIAVTERMKIQNSVLAAHSSSFVQMEGAQIWRMYVMEEVSAEITVTKPKYALVCTI